MHPEGTNSLPVLVPLNKQVWRKKKLLPSITETAT